MTWASGLAPSGTVHIFNCQNLYNQNIDAAYSQCATELGNGTRPNMHQLSMSFGGPEEGQGSSAFATDHQYFTTIASYGVSVFASSGDNGAFDNSGNLSVSYPASDPEITGVGRHQPAPDLLGHHFYRDRMDHGWELPGIRGHYRCQRRRRQHRIFASRATRPAAACPAAPCGWCRTWPPPPTRTRARCSFSPIPRVASRKSTSIGGTSWSAPCWNAFAGLLTQKRATAGKASLGFLNGQLYPLLSTSSFRDITTGNNSHYQSSDGYSCKAGY